MRNITTSMGIAFVLLCLCLMFPTEIPAPALVRATPFSAEKYTGYNAKITMSVVKADITPNTEELSVLVVNHSGEDQSYGRIFYLEREENSQWLPVSPLPGAAFEKAMVFLPPNTANEETLDIGTYYGSLQPGSYRVIKTFGDAYASGTFYVREV
ncbi:immunoglobulin-like domain-containing protein [Eubacterium callanderi]|uniref:Bacterial Ig-like domain-containing protein n=1 Tax=Eubacterium callanderi TaxID=53442 RepID=A0A853JPJ7_9FIRM|nr:hypothetical protein [Eubacterium callanderi]